jgi:hypothetical protein
VPKSAERIRAHPLCHPQVGTKAMKSKTVQTILILAALAGGCDDNNSEPPTSNVPSACVGIDLLHESEACIEALSTKCRAETTESGCWAVQSVTVGDQAVQSVGCRWTHVAVLADADTCEITSAFGRCEAAVGSTGLGNPPIADPCKNGAFGEAGHSVITDSNELVDWVEAPDDRYSDVIGPWELSSCVAGATPAAPSQWCACAAEACAATAAL